MRALRENSDKGARRDHNQADKASRSPHAGQTAVSAGEDRHSAHDVLGFIVDHEKTLSRSHRKIAHAILGDPKTFVEKPIEELVPWLGISAPTITRFSRRIGCDGLRDLKLKIMGSMRVGMRYLEPATPPGTLAEAGERIVMRAQRAILEAHRTIDFAQLDRAIDLISHSRMIYAFGGGGVSSWLVEEIHNRLFRLGLHVAVSVDHQMQMMLAATVDRGDVIFCSSLSGNNAELVKAVRIASDYGASSIALTIAGTPLAEAVDLALTPDGADEWTDILCPTPLRYAFLTIIDIVAYGAAIRMRPAAQEKLRRIKQQFTTYRDADANQPSSD